MLIVRNFRDLPMDSVMTPLRIEGLNLPEKGSKSQFTDAAITGGRAERFACGVALYMGDRRGLDGMVQVRRDLGALLPLPTDSRLRHFAMDAFEFIRCVALLDDVRAVFRRIAAR